VEERATQDEQGATSLDRLILNYNNENPNEGFYPATPRASFTYRGESVRMTSAEYHDFLVRSGRLSYMRLQGMDLNVERPTRVDVEKIDYVLRRTREQVKRQMIRAGQFSGLERMFDSGEMERPDVEMTTPPSQRRRAGTLLLEGER